MNDYTRAGIFITLGLIGALAHWVKKRYVDNTTTSTLKEYTTTDVKYTLRAVGTIVFTEVNLSLLGVEFPGMSEALGALTAGYAVDSSLNKVTEDA